jgi:CDP-diacylglycerol--glycerol-3-phosphate 3-phosphatidyltransferase
MINFPNILTSLRILVALIAPFFLINETVWTRIIAGVFIFLAILTDWLDGWYARKYNQITNLGKILDPIADKVLIFITFSVFVYLDVVAIWWIIPIFIREIIVTIYRFVFLSKNIVIAATQSGKIKTVMQMITIGIAYFWLITHKHFKEYHYTYVTFILQIALGITLFLTIKSGVNFLMNNWKNIKKFHQIS